ncbi:hypothetical protein [Lysobacter gummosus]|uniref:hypothetical protein n=1 Tax=Lysobacter gummosus TaxID=262324 RepID=UPI003626D9C4
MLMNYHYSSAGFAKFDSLLNFASVTSISPTRIAIRSDHQVVNFGRRGSYYLAPKPRNGLGEVWSRVASGCACKTKFRAVKRNFRADSA